MPRTHDSPLASCKQITFEEWVDFVFQPTTKAIAPTLLSRRTLSPPSYRTRRAFSMPPSHPISFHCVGQAGDDEVRDLSDGDVMKKDQIEKAAPHLHTCTPDLHGRGSSRLDSD